MEDTHRGQHTILAEQHVAQVFNCDIETVQTQLQKIRGKIAIDSEILKKQKRVNVVLCPGNF